MQAANKFAVTPVRVAAFSISQENGFVSRMRVESQKTFNLLEEGKSKNGGSNVEAKVSLSGCSTLEGNLYILPILRPFMGAIMPQNGPESIGLCLRFSAEGKLSSTKFTYRTKSKLFKVNRWGRQLNAFCRF